MTDEERQIESLRSEVEELEEELAEEKVAHPIELFFDLVFVFAFTRVVSLVVHDLTLAGVSRGALLLALLWWAWGNWTWTTNVVDLEPRAIRVAVLASMLGVFGMGFAVPTAFAGDGLWIAMGYAWVRAVAGAVFVFGTRHDKAEQRAIMTYLPVSAVSPIVVFVGAAIGGDAQQWIWLGALAVEVTAAALSGKADWKIDAGHFAERHGLILIIAMGEAIIAVGVALEKFEIDTALAIRLAVGLLGVCALWWAYFDRLQHVFEVALRDADAHETGHIARDVYSFLHYPMILAIVLYAVALEEAFLHPEDPMPNVVATIFVSAIALYLLAQAAAVWRCFRNTLYERAIGVAVIAAIVSFWDGAAQDVVLVATVVLMLTLTAEYVRFRSEIRGQL